MKKKISIFKFVFYNDGNCSIDRHSRHRGVPPCIYKAFKAKLSNFWKQFWIFLKIRPVISRSVSARSFWGHLLTRSFSANICCILYFGQVHLGGFEMKHIETANHKFVNSWFMVSNFSSDQSLYLHQTNYLINLSKFLKKLWNLALSVVEEKDSLVSEKGVQYPLAPMGVLAPGSAHARPSARPPIDTSGNFSAHMSGGGETVWQFFWSTFSPNQRILSTFRFFQKKT